jgi:hypothetical protein
MSEKLNRYSGRPLADVRITPENCRRADIGGRIKRVKTGREQMQQMTRPVIRSPRRRGRAASAALLDRVPRRSSG